MGVNTMITEADDNADTLLRRIIVRASRDNEMVATWDRLLKHYDTLVAERDAMKDSLRWRKQSEEKAPDEMFVQYRSTLASEFGAYGHCLGSDLKSTDEWLPVPT